MSSAQPSAEKQKLSKVLVIDDDPLIRQLVIRILADSNYQVVEASSGMDGLAKTETFQPDLVLLDLMMPGMDGYEVCKRMRQLPATANVPIVILTALDQLDEKVHGFRVGADDYITKPIDSRELFMRINAHLRRSMRELGSSPLTGLPGNPMIEQIIRVRLQAQEPVAVLYVDLDNFKSFNDAYGWIQGDTVIKALAVIIRTVVQETGNKDDFVGHIGGDDFVILSTPDLAPTMAERIIAEFDKMIPEHYSEEARTRGYLVSNDRRGRPFRAPIATVAIAIVTNKNRDLQTPTQIASLAAEVKKYVKSHPGSHYAFDRRSK
jgi:diguanylate cyclase (GGDEF)-like protein